MIAAIREMIDKKDDSFTGRSDLMTADYLEACHFIFETGILSHEKIESISSPCLLNMNEGIKWFVKWKETLAHDPGMSM